MRRTVVRYQAKPELAAENERLIANVFNELSAKSPSDVRYLVVKLADQTFLHFAIAEDASVGSPLQKLEAFRIFTSRVNERCIEPPRASEATIVGNYRMLMDG